MFNKESLEFIRTPTWEEWQQVMEYLSYCRRTLKRRQFFDPRRPNFIVPEDVRLVGCPL